MNEAFVNATVSSTFQVRWTIGLGLVMSLLVGSCNSSSDDIESGRPDASETSETARATEAAPATAVDSATTDAQEAETSSAQPEDSIEHKEEPNSAPEVDNQSERTDSAGNWEVVQGGRDCMCSDGSDWSFWVREADPKRVVFFLDGGGACWNELTCNPAQGFYQPVVDESDNPNGAQGIFDLGNSANPVADWSWIAVPYCTADVHLGDATRKYGDVTIHHSGMANGNRALDELLARFPDADQFLVTGASAGGVASPVYAGLVANLFPEASVLAIADGSGAYPHATEVSGPIGQSWGVDSSLPEWVQTSRTNFTIPGTFVAAGNRFENITFARFDHAQDQVQAAFIAVAGLSLDGAAGQRDQILQTEAMIEAEIGSVASYVASGKDHTALARSELYTLSENDVPLVGWLTSLLSGDLAADVLCENCGP